MNETFLKMYKFHPILLIFLFLTGCVSTNTEIEPKNYQHVSQIKSFSVSGKVGIIQGKEKESVNFHWKQNNNDYHITFSTFLGIEVARIEGGYQNIKIVADGKTFGSTEPEVLLKDVTGWNIPLRHLSRWIKGTYSGVVMAKHSSTELPKKVLARVSSDEEWIIDYQSYQPIHQLQLPKKMQLKQYGSKILLSINEWDIE